MKFYVFDDLIVFLLKVCSGYVFDIENNEGKILREYLIVLKWVYV